MREYLAQGVMKMHHSKKKFFSYGIKLPNPLLETGFKVEKRPVQD